MPPRVLGRLHAVDAVHDGERVYLVGVALASLSYLIFPEYVINGIVFNFGRNKQR